jgi:DNA-binding NarL/FixJ family response regulator
VSILKQARVTSLGKKKIFIVEDLGVVQLELRKILEGLGYEIAGTATTGEEAVEGCTRDRPDLILMDVVLPGGINGIEASRLISRKIDVPVIFTTAYSDQDIIDEVQKSFPFGFVIKPYREKDLLVAIETAFTRYEYEKKLEESERKYKSLFEGTNDIILILDENLRVLSANRAVLNYLSISPGDIASRNFLDLVYLPEKKNVQSMILIREKLDRFLHDRKAINFKTALQSKFNNEPIEMNLRLESISMPSGNLIMCRASRDIDDEMTKLFVSDEQELAMGNQLFLIGDVAYRLTRDLRKYLDPDTTELVRLSLVEMIINAIEHGNLEISYQEKSAALQSGSYGDFIARRQEDPRYKKRLVHIKYRINSLMASYTITDDGKGFDHSLFMKNEIADTNINLKPHGRGLYMSRKIFDDVIYNEKGSSVTVVKKFRGA